MAQRTAARKAIEGFLENEVAELGVKRKGRPLVTTPEEIARHTEFDAKTVKKCLLMFAGKRTDGKILMVKVGRTDVVIRLAEKHKL